MIWEVIQGQAAFRTKFEHDAPVLACCFSGDGQRLISGGCDQQVRLRDLQAQQSITLGSHEQPVKHVAALDEMNLFVSGSWDKTLRFWSPQQQKPVLTLDLPERVYAMDVKSNLMVIGCADRHVLSYDLKRIQQSTTPLKAGVSAVKTQTRSIACFPDGTGYALGSVEGRVSVQDFQDSKKTFTFKSKQTNENTLCAVNALDFHPAMKSVMATCGSDGQFVMWDKDSKKCLTKFTPCKFAITAGKFNRTGNYFAYSVSYDWSQGHKENNGTAPRQVFIHQYQTG